jgi:hypothetical protein
MTNVFTAGFTFCITLLLLTPTTFYASGQQVRNLCDMTPDGSVWLTVARLSFAEQKFHKLNGRYGGLIEMTDLEPGLPLDITSTGRMGSYIIRIELTKDGFILRANPEYATGRRRLASFYGDQTGLVTFDRSGKPAGPKSEKMGGP